jgi:hypothetical protein
MKSTIVREFHAKRIDKVLNDPSVLPYVSLRDSPRPLALQSLLNDPRNVLLMHESGLGGVLAHWQEPGVYDMHIQFLPEVRGPVALTCVQEALAYMFLKTDAMELLTKVPERNASARGMCELIEGRLEFTAGTFGDQAVEHWALRYPDWLWQSGVQQKELEEIGSEFHEILEEKLASAGIANVPHPASEAHDRVVGATYSMILAGQLDKAMALFVRFSRAAGFAQMVLLSRPPGPIILDVEGCVLYLEPPDFHVLPVKKDQP